MTGGGSALLLPFVLVSFAANSLITRYVVEDDLLDAGLLTGVRFLAGALALAVLAGVLRERPVVGRGNALPALWLGAYAVCISYGYQHIGAAAGTFVFYAAVLLTLVAVDRRAGRPLPVRRAVGALVALAGIGVLASASVDTVRPLGVLLLTATGAAWGLYTAAGRGRATRAASPPATSCCWPRSSSCRRVRALQPGCTSRPRVWSGASSWAPGRPPSPTSPGTPASLG